MSRHTKMPSRAVACLPRLPPGRAGRLLRLGDPCVSLQPINLDLAIELVEIAEVFEYAIDSCHLRASRYLHGPASRSSHAGNPFCITVEIRRPVPAQGNPQTACLDLIKNGFGKNRTSDEGIAFLPGRIRAQGRNSKEGVFQKINVYGLSDWF